MLLDRLICSYYKYEDRANSYMGSDRTYGACLGLIICSIPKE
jgi:hypothetical protein